MQRANEATCLAAARDGDHEAFGLLIAPYRRELLVHCYRILGSLEDAEDALQEALLRAWRRLGSFAERAPLRAWLYKIATHAALDAYAGRKARSLPPTALAPADPTTLLPASRAEPHWLSPLPDALLDGSSASPEARYDARESVSLAFLAALQLLPPRQRAVLILRDVLDWRAAEVANLLDLSVAAANSALQRARSTMQRHRDSLAAETVAPTSDERIATLLARYVRAWEVADVTGLVALLREDAAYRMPPLPLWYRGPAAIGAFLIAEVFAGRAEGRFHLLATRANGCPAFAVYARNEDGVYRPTALQVLAITGDRIAAIHAFLSLDHRLLAHFGLPATL